MTFGKFERALVIGALALVSIGPTLAAPVQGVGSAPITKDVETVRTQAEASAKRDLVMKLLKQQIGQDRLKEVSDSVIASLASQIQAAMIVDRQAAKDGNLYTVTLVAEIDAAWFHGLLDDEGIHDSSNLAGAQRQLIFVMLDESNGIGQDASRPTAVHTEYDRRTGKSYADQSISASSDKEKAAVSLSDKTAVSARSSGAAGYSDYSGSGAASTRSRGSAASSSKGAAAYSRSTSAIDKADVHAEQHDDVRLRQTITYQAGVTKSGPAGAALSGLTGQLISYGIEMADPTMALNEYFKGKVPNYSDIKIRPDFADFTRFVATKNAPFFMGGTISITDTGKDGATGLFRCAGRLNGSAFATDDGHLIGAGDQSANAVAGSFEDCQAQVSQSLAKLLADQVGPLIQRYWRGKIRSRQDTIAAATQGGEYTLVIRATDIDMGMQADIFDALGAISGVSKQAMTDQTSKQMSFQVSYQGTVPLQVALFQKLRAHPSYAKLKPTVDGRLITLCISGCQ